MNLTKNQDFKYYLDMSLTEFTREITVNMSYLVGGYVYSALPRKFSQTHIKVMFTVLIFGQTHIVTFTVFSFSHLYSVILTSLA